MIVLGASQGQASREPQVREGTAVLAGIVSGSDGKPVPRAVVTLGGTVTLTVIAEPSGRFMFDRLPAGRFVLSASKAGFLTLAYGQPTPGRGSGMPIELKDAERRIDLRWSLPRAASISGRILDHSGRPFRNAVVTLQQRRTVDGESRLVTCCGNTTSDANGLYRIAGLLPGDYLVSALPASDYRFIPDVLSSFGEEMHQTTDEEVRWALREIESASNANTPASPRLPDPPRGSTVSYGRIYFPGTADAARAAVVTVKNGDDRSGADFSMALLPTAFIRGRVLLPDGQPAANASFSFSDGWSMATMRVGADGTFERRNLLPGKYTVIARVSTPSAPALWGSREFNLNGTNEPDVVITLGAAASVSGRLAFEAGEASPNPGAVSMSVMLSPLLGTTPARVGADGTFSFPVVDPGRYRLSASIPAASRGAWLLKSAMVGDRDAADMPFEVKAGQAVTDVVVTFTTKATRLTGTLLTADDQPAPGYYVVVFADDPAQWIAGSRRVPAPVRAATDGRFAFTGLPAGSYRLAALTSVDTSDLANADFLAALKPGAALVTLADGENKTQDVKFARVR